MFTFIKKVIKTGTATSSYPLIPLGGYVKMLDERVEPVAPEMRHYAFNNKTAGPARR